MRLLQCATENKIKENQIRKAYSVRRRHAFNNGAVHKVCVSHSLATTARHKFVTYLHIYLLIYLLAYLLPEREMRLLI